jgi:hypothetical protein
VYAIIARLDPALTTLAHEGPARFRDQFELVHRHRASHPNAIWQADDALDVAMLHQLPPDLPFGVAAKQHAVRQDARTLTGALERPHDVQQIRIVPLLRRWRSEGLEPAIRVIGDVEPSAPELVRTEGSQPRNRTSRAHPPL